MAIQSIADHIGLVWKFILVASFIMGIVHMGIWHLKEIDEDPSKQSNLLMIKLTYPKGERILQIISRMIFVLIIGAAFAVYPTMKGILLADVPPFADYILAYAVVLVSAYIFYLLGKMVFLFATIVIGIICVLFTVLAGSIWQIIRWCFA